MAESSKRPRTHFVAHLPDLITEEDYKKPTDRQTIRLRIQRTDQGIEILGDSIYAASLEELLSSLEVDEIERMLCG
jgi:hypothetical protein